MIFGRDIVERRSWILDVYVVEALLPTEFKTPNSLNVGIENLLFH